MKKYLILVYLCFLIINACKKDENIDHTPNLPPVNSLLCSGNGTDSYYPLAVNNKWTYYNASSEITNINVITLIKEIQNINYYEISNNHSPRKIYLRKDNSNNVIVLDSLTEYILIPANPTNGQQWEFYGKVRKKVLDVNTIYITNACYQQQQQYYKNVLAIQSMFWDVIGQDTLFWDGGIEYYKKGLGLIAIESVGLQQGNSSTLIDVILN